MSEEKNISLAKQVYNTLCNAIEKRKWNYQKEDDELSVFFNVDGDDIPMRFILLVDVNCQLIRLFSLLPFNMSESKRVEGAIATCVASFKTLYGNFEYNLADGSIAFRMTASFRNSLIGEGLFQHMISCSCAAVDEYNDQFLAIDKGFMSITDFIERNYKSSN